jgi:putative phosphoesterase
LKIGLISDIHGDIEALKRALDLLTATKVETILCAGDLIEHDPHSSEMVVTRIRSLAIPCVQGNHDQSAISLLKWVRERDGDLATLPERHRLTMASLEYLAGLPLIRHFYFSGRSLALTHGTPWSPFVSLFASEPPDLFVRATQAARADILVVGHTHTPMALRCGDTLVVNPGALWRNHPIGRQYGQRTCGVLDTTTNTFSVIDVDTGQISQPTVTHIDEPQE